MSQENIQNKVTKHLWSFAGFHKLCGSTVLGSKTCHLLAKVL